MHENVI